jgi:hypothetical protein
MQMRTFNDMYGCEGYMIARTGKPGTMDQYTVFYNNEPFCTVPDILEAVSEVEFKLETEKETMRLM